ncbi:hypothetical protein AMTRI_Chr12g236010 [Amborella trichopoda]
MKKDLILVLFVAVILVLLFQPSSVFAGRPFLGDAELGLSGRPFRGDTELVLSNERGRVFETPDVRQSHMGVRIGMLSHRLASGPSRKGAGH